MSQGWVSSPAGALASRPGTRVWPLLIALLPLFLRATAGRFPVRRTAFDLPLGVFLLTAGVGAWISYDPAAGWAKFWVILGAVFLYYALAGQPEENLWLAAGLLGFLGAITAGAFLLGQGFQSGSADLEPLNWIGQRWLAVRPVALGWDLPPNLAGGLLAALAPLPAALAAAAWRTRRLGAGLCALIALALIGLGLVLTSSRGAWIALLAALGAGCLWKFSRLVARYLGKPPEAVFILAALLAAALLLGLMAVQPGGLAGLGDRLPGLPSGGSRLELARNSLHLLADFPFTGGGLAAFAGLYAQYIMVIPVFLYGYSHNFYLDVALEQGLLGGLALVVILLGSGALLSTRWPKTQARDGLGLLRGALFGGLIVVAVHGLVDDALYGGGGTPLLFCLPGLAVALAQPGRDGRIIQNAPARYPGAAKTSRVLVGVTSLAILAGFFVTAGKSALASWYANQGAVALARAELAGFPWGEWDVERLQRVYATKTVQSASAAFDRALQLNAHNSTASYRLGLIALGRGDLSAAHAALQRAHQAAPQHRGIAKVLGYTCIWDGELEQGLPLLKGIAEAQREMEIYAWWWRDHGQVEFADRSAQAAALLAEADAGNQ